MSFIDPAVVVVGAGPAGLAAARAISERGVGPVLVLDRDDAAGGLPRFCRHPGFGWEYSHRLETGPAFASRLVGCLDTSVVTIETRTTALGVRQGPEIEIIGPKCGHALLRPRAIILTTGIRERPRSARLAPGMRPERGILTTGQLQQMVARGVSIPGRRVVVIGTEHVSFSILFTAWHAGMHVVAMIGKENRVMSFAPAGWLARSLLGVAIHLSSEVTDIEGTETVESVSIAGSGGTSRIACDAVVFSGDFVPDAALLRQSGIDIDTRTAGPIVDQFGRTTMPGIFAAGNLLRAIESSGRAALEGRAVGINAATFVAGKSPWPEARTIVQLDGCVEYMVPQYWAKHVGKELVSLPISLRSSSDLRRAHLLVSKNGCEIRKPVRSLKQRRIKLPTSILRELQDGNPARLSIDAA